MRIANLGWIMVAAVLAAGCGSNSTTTPAVPDHTSPAPAAVDVNPDTADGLPDSAVADEPGAESTWHHFTWAEAGFTVDLPLSVWTNHPSEKMEGAPPNVYLARAVAPGLGTFWCMSFQLQKSAPEMSVQQRLKTAQEGAVNSMNGKLLDEAEIELAGHPGREFTIELPNGTIVRQRIYQVGDRLHQLQIEALARENLDDPRVQRFLTTYQLLEP